MRLIWVGCLKPSEWRVIPPRDISQCLLEINGYHKKKSFLGTFHLIFDFGKWKYLLNCPIFREITFLAPNQNPDDLDVLNIVVVARKYGL